MQLVCENRAVENTLPEREPNAYLWFSLLSVCMHKGIKKVLQVNIVDEIKDTMHYRHAVKSVPLGQTPGGGGPLGGFLCTSSALLQKCHSLCTQHTPVRAALRLKRQGNTNGM